MKYNYKNLFIILLGTSMFTTGCKKDFGEINSNPTQLTTANFDPNSLLTSVQLTYTGSTDFAFEAWRNNLGECSVMIQLFSSTIFPGDKYSQDFTYMASYWNRAYPEQVKPVVELVALTKDKPQFANLYQIGRLMKAMVLQRITDLYGDVPYSQAGLAYYERKFYPVYDKQSTIYPDLIKEIEEASAALDVTKDKPTGDAMFGGDIAKWKRFGYSLLLRAGMRLTKVDEATAKTTALKAVGKTMSSNADNAFVRGSGSGIDRTVNNRNSQVLLGDGGGGEHFYTKWSKTLIDFMKTNTDPRLTRVARVNVWSALPTSVVTNPTPSAAFADQKGMPNGKSTGSVNDGNSIYYDPSFVGAVGAVSGLNQYSSVNLLMAQRTSPTYFLNYGESELLLAEAAQRWGTAYGTAIEHYSNGVKGSMTYLTQYDVSLAIPDAEATAYLAAHPYNAATGLDMINTQYWAATGTALNFYEAWSNWRRSGYPLLVPVNYPGNPTGGTIPRRHMYPLEESASNEANLNAARAGISGGDQVTSRMWWDK